MLTRRFIRIRTVKALYAYLKSESKNPDTALKALIHSLDKSYDLYLRMLTLPEAIVCYAAERIEIGLNKKLPTEQDLHPNYRFVNNRAAELLAQSESLQKEIAKRHLSWDGCQEVIKDIYQNMSDSDWFREYMESPASGFKQDVSAIIDMFIHSVQDNAILESKLEDESLDWFDALDYALVMAIATLERLHGEAKEITPLKQYTTDDDLPFAKELFLNSVSSHDEHMKMIDKFTTNWEVERVACLDTIIVSAAMTEFERMPSIPVKVTMDEYIEIAKFYSTAGSGTFVNGLLDKLAREMKADGRIVKNALGLVE